MSAEDDIKAMLGGGVMPIPQAQQQIVVSKPLNDQQLICLMAATLCAENNNPIFSVTQAYEIFCQVVARFDPKRISARMEEIHKSELLKMES
jgi:hypothetical protein